MHPSGLCNEDGTYNVTAIMNRAHNHARQAVKLYNSKYAVEFKEALLMAWDDARSVWRMANRDKVKMVKISEADWQSMRYDGRIEQ